MLSVRDLAVEYVVGAEHESGHHGSADDEQRHARQRKDADEEDEDRRDHGQGNGDHANREEPVDLLRVRFAGPDEALPDLLDVADGCQPAPYCLDSVNERPQGTVPERIQQLLVAGVLDLVAVQLPQRLADDLSFLDLGQHHEHDHGNSQGHQDGNDEKGWGHLVKPRW